MLLINEILLVVVILGQCVIWWLLWRMSIDQGRLLVSVTSLSANQKGFKSTVKLMNEHMEDVWESKSTRKQVIESHDQQEKEHAEILDLLRDGQTPKSDLSAGID